MKYFRICAAMLAERPDMLEIGNGAMSDTEYKTHMSLWCILAAPLLAGNDLRDMQPRILEILTNKEATAVDQDKMGKQGVRVFKNGDLEVWSKPLADGGHAVGLFNRGADTAKVTAKWSDIGVNGAGVKGAHRVRDLWEHADKGGMTDEYAAEVPSHGGSDGQNRQVKTMKPRLLEGKCIESPIFWS